ncbi:MAG: PspC domain-containing protein [Planctomycetota bacterium]|jgi:phage shock protein PspC (stress-responsive transcriptional regulator)
MKRVYLSTTDKKLLGICGGIGEAYGVDPNLVRVAAVFLCLATAVLPLAAAYITGWFLIPSGHPD